MLHQVLNMPCNEYWRTPKQTGDVGVEIELEGDYLPHEVQGWLVKPENSLRGRDGRPFSAGEDLPDTPREYVTRTSVSLSLLETRLTGLHKALSAAPVVVRLSPRASTHIHLNMQGETLRTLLGTLMIYAMAEPVLIRVCGPERNGNLFCLPLYETGDLPPLIGLWARHCADGQHMWSNRGRYAALNTDALRTYGSIEVRSFPVTIDPPTILRWARWLVYMRGKARGYPDETFNGLIDAVYRDPQSFAAEIFTGQANLHSLCYPNNITELVRKGVEVAHEIRQSAKPVLFFDENAKPVRKLKKLRNWDMEPDFDSDFFAPAEPV